MKLRRICVFCASSPGRVPSYRAAAAAFGRALGERGLELVYGGGKVGLMGELANAALAAGVPVTGVIPEALMAKEVGHRGLPDLRVVGSMHERKALMVDLADAFVMLPGGFGTYEEFCEVLTWSQLGFHQKPCGVLDVDRFFESLMAFFDHATAEGFVSQAHRDIVLCASTPEALLDRLAAWVPVASPKWIDRGET